MSDFIFIWWKELLYFLLYCFIIGLIIGWSYFVHEWIARQSKPELKDSMFNYNRLPKFLPSNGFYFDTHSHTRYSDGIMTVEQNVLWHRANGFKAFVLTDHNTGKGNPEIPALQAKYPDILIIPGVEWTTQNVHLILMGITEYPHRIPQVASPEDVQFAIAKAHELGAIVQISHITWTQWQPSLAKGKLKHPTREQLVEWGVDGFEINNEVRWYDPESVYFVENYRKDPNHKQIFLSTGTDIHSPMKDWVTGWTQLLLTDEEQKKPTIEIIKRALSQGRTKIWVSHDYDTPPELKLGVNPSRREGVETIFYPFGILNNGLRSIPTTGKKILSLVLWLIALYIFLRVTFFIL